ncbi:hypothetical protein F5878DRAFT_549855 [Lentinula raphanica]|uniref:Uncharacterized protein n=1 Tax=Lentinula raphanica TaxID=153919 RepID=A0AA38NV27_9AGAR|nr:hypothetical protein F5878DRAFT_549855 [Lentinula raphanica]
MHRSYSLSCREDPCSKQKSSSLGFEQEEEDKEEVLERTPEEERSTALISLAKYPKEARKKIEAISLLHGAPGFAGALKLFLNDCLSPFHKLKKGDALKKRLPFTTLEVWHNFGLVPLEVLDPPEKYLIKAQPLSSRKAARFDTVLVLENELAQSTAVQGK